MRVCHKIIQDTVGFLLSKSIMTLCLAVSEQDNGKWDGWEPPAGQTMHNLSIPPEQSTTMAAF